MIVCTAWCEYDIGMEGRIFTDADAAIEAFNTCAEDCDVGDFYHLQDAGLAGITAVEVEE